MTHPERRVRVEVPARTPEEAREAAWERWYRRPVRDEFDERLRDAFGTEDTGKPAGGREARMPSGPGVRL